MLESYLSYAFDPYRVRHWIRPSGIERRYRAVWVAYLALLARNRHFNWPLLIDRFNDRSRSRASIVYFRFRPRSSAYRYRAPIFVASLPRYEKKKRSAFSLISSSADGTAIVKRRFAIVRDGDGVRVDGSGQKKHRRAIGDGAKGSPWRVRRRVGTENDATIERSVASRKDRFPRYGAAIDNAPSHSTVIRGSR